MIAIDTNILVHAHRRDSGWHAQAAQVLREAAEGRAPWAIPWPCLYEFFAVVTHPRIYAPPSTVPQAVAQIDAWLESPSLVVLGETPASWPALKTMLESSRVTGPQVHDARIAALCAVHGITELWTVDRDFSRFQGIATRNSLLAS